MKTLKITTDNKISIIDVNHKDGLSIYEQEYIEATIRKLEDTLKQYIHRLCTTTLRRRSSCWWTRKD